LKVDKQPQYEDTGLLDVARYNHRLSKSLIDGDGGGQKGSVIFE